MTFTVLLTAGTALLGNGLGLAGLGRLAHDTGELQAGLAAVVGPRQAATARLPSSLALLGLVALLAALVAGWTVWRGPLWDELRPRGAIRRTFVIGLAWGLWHTPLILQGHDYPGHPVLGVGVLVVFDTAT